MHTSKVRLDTLIVARGLASTRSQAANLITMGKVRVKGSVAQKPGQSVSPDSEVKVSQTASYVSRAGYKLASVAQALHLRFRHKTVLDVGSSTGGFTDFALQHGAAKVIAVDVGTKQLHPTLHGDPRIELHEQTDIRTYVKGLTSHIDMILVDVSFISLREILSSLTKCMSSDTQLVVMVKPQFEARESGVKHKGVIKNDTMRRKILKDFELWVKNMFIIIDKADSEVSGSKGNKERFYVLKMVSKH